jgi:hypothetical protein
VDKFQNCAERHAVENGNGLDSWQGDPRENKRIVENKVYKLGDSTAKVVHVPVVEDAVKEHAVVLLGCASVPSRVRGQDIIDLYQVSQSLLRDHARRRMTTSAWGDGKD